MKDKIPAERESQRYLRFKIHSEKELGFREVLQTVKNSTREFMGLKELSRAQPWMMKNRFDKSDQEGVIKVNREYENDLRAALTLSELPGNGFFEFTEVSGSLRSL